jgi:hypothetical protein
MKKIKKVLILAAFFGENMWGRSYIYVSHTSSD